MFCTEANIVISWCGVAGMAADMTHVVVDGERGILRATHFSVFVALAEAVRAWSIAELCSLREEFRRILIVDKYDVVDAPFVQESKLVKSMRELGSGVFGGAFEPLDAFFRSL
jgi:hypothetical protein